MKVETITTTPRKGAWLLEFDNGAVAVLYPPKVGMRPQQIIKHLEKMIERVRVTTKFHELQTKEAPNALDESPPG